MQDKITVNSVGPGLFESEMTADTLFSNEAFMNFYSNMNPAGLEYKAIKFSKIKKFMGPKGYVM